MAIAFQEKNIDFKSLVNHADFPSISIYLGNDQVWPNNHRAKISLKNLVRKARYQLHQLNLPKAEIDKHLAGVDPYLEDSDLWKNTSNSLAIFLAPNVNRTFEVNLPFQDSIHIGHFFDIRVLLPYLHFEALHLVLLSQEEICVLKVTAGDYCKIEIPGLVESFTKFIKFDDIKNGGDVVLFDPNKISVAEHAIALLHHSA